MRRSIPRARPASRTSRPGYGASDGPADFCGPKTQAAVETVIGHFHRQPFVDPQRIAIDGTSRGAIVAAMLATKHPTLAAVVLTGGAYDLKSVYRDTCEGTFSALTSMLPGSACWNAPVIGEFLTKHLDLREPLPEP